MRVGARPRQLVSGRRTAFFQSKANRLDRTKFPIALMALIGVILPYEISIYLGGAKFTPGRLAVSLLLIPALFALCGKNRRFVLPDFFMFATAAWMLGAAYAVGGTASLWSAGAEALELIAGYFVGRSFFFGLPALDSFVAVLKALTIILVLMAVADELSGQYIMHKPLAWLSSYPPPFPQFREDMLRATASLEHPILFGTFCTIAAAIFLYAERDLIRRVLYVGICLFGCTLSLSSGPLLAFGIVLAVYTYDQLMQSYPWRWKLLWAGVFGFILCVFLVSNRPVGWLVSHLTLDPMTGYYRIMIWDIAFDRISLRPFAGYGFNPFHDAYGNGTVDCVWLVVALTYGLPMGALLLITNLTAVLFNGQTKFRNAEPHMNNMRMAFTLAVTTFMLIGLTVHFWNFVWIFWSMCIGIRASFREQSANTFARSSPKRQLASYRRGFAH